MRKPDGKGKRGIAAARESLDRAFAERPDDWVALSERSRFLFEHGTTEEAEPRRSRHCSTVGPTTPQRTTTAASC